MSETFIGQLTGATFSFNPAREMSASGWGQRFKGRNVDTGEVVFIHRLDTLNAGFENDMRRARSAIALARRPDVASCGTIVAFVDVCDETIDDGFGEPYELLASAWQWADATLRDTIDEGGFDAARLAVDVSAGIELALDCLHRSGLVHSDVAPNNVLRVGSVWKLADLNHCVANGEPITGLPQACYVAQGVKLGDAADASIDRYALTAVLDEIRARSA